MACNGTALKGGLNQKVWEPLPYSIPTDDLLLVYLWCFNYTGYIDNTDRAILMVHFIIWGRKRSWPISNCYPRVCPEAPTISTKILREMSVSGSTFEYGAFRNEAGVLTTQPQRSLLIHLTFMQKWAYTFPLVTMFHSMSY